MKIDFLCSKLAQPQLSCCFGLIIDHVRREAEIAIRGESGDTLQLLLDYGDGLFEDLFFTAHGEKCAVTAVRRLHHHGNSILHLNELYCDFEAIDFSGGKSSDDYFYHLENPRIYERFCIPVDEDRTGAQISDTEFDPLAGNRWADPGTIHERIGRSPYQPFPAILLSNMTSVYGLVHGTLSQNVFYHCYETGHNETGLYLKVISAFKAIDYREIHPGEILVDEWYFEETREADKIEHFFDGYTAELRRKLPANYGATEINRHSLVWGSWNDGNHRNINSEQLLKTAQYLKETFPTVKWIQIDDGYSNEACRLNIAHGLGMPYEGKDGIDYSRFPEGMKVFFDAIRRIGLRPAIWIGGLCPKATRIYREKPEWFCNYDHRVTASAPLDISQPEVWKYMLDALDMLLMEFGCEGMKHDFWSYVFEESMPLFANHCYSGYEYRRNWLVEIRKRLSSDGYLQTGCDIVMGNPFLGEYFTNYRYGIDIGSGNWDCVKTSFLWGSACFATHTGDLFVPNSDSVGLFPGLTDNEALFCINYCLVTGSMVEIAGNLDLHVGEPRMEILQKAVCCPDNGHNVYFANFDYRAGHHAPDCFYFKGTIFSLLRDNPLLPIRTLAFFNLNDIALDRSVMPIDLGLTDGEYLAYDIWADEYIEFSERLETNLALHGSRLFAIVPRNQFAVLDANIKLDAVSCENHIFSLKFAHPGKLRLRLWNGTRIIVLERILNVFGETVEVRV